MHKILIATDSFDQVNGVSTTYRNILKHSRKKTFVVHPGLFKWTNFSVYPEVQFCTEPLKAYNKIKDIAPTHIHIGTEGPIGLAARIYCKLNKIPYTTGYHTKFPEYLWKLARIPKFITYAYLKVFHNDSKAILVPSRSCQEELTKKGFNHVEIWTKRDKVWQTHESRQAAMVWVISELVRGSSWCESAKCGQHQSRS